MEADATSFAHITEFNLLQLNYTVCLTPSHLTPWPSTLLVLATHFIEIIMDPSCNELLHQMGQVNGSEVSREMCCGQIHSQ